MRVAGRTGIGGGNVAFARRKRKLGVAAVLLASGVIGLLLWLLFSAVFIGYGPSGPEFERATAQEASRCIEEWNERVGSDRSAPGPVPLDDEVVVGTTHGESQCQVASGETVDGQLRGLRYIERTDGRFERYRWAETLPASESAPNARWAESGELRLLDRSE